MNTDTTGGTPFPWEAHSKDLMDCAGCFRDDDVSWPRPCRCGGLIHCEQVSQETLVQQCSRCGDRFQEAS